MPAPITRCKSLERTVLSLFGGIATRARVISPNSDLATDVRANAKRLFRPYVKIAMRDATSRVATQSQTRPDGI